MPRPTSKSTDWAALLSQELKKREKTPDGPGWETFVEIRKNVGTGIVTLRGAIQSAISSGRVEKFNGTTVDGDGKLRRTIWYRKVSP